MIVPVPVHCFSLTFLRHTLALSSRLEYAAPIWQPYHKNQIRQVKKAQRFFKPVVFYLLSNFGISQAICLKYQCIEAYIRDLHAKLCRMLCLYRKNHYRYHKLRKAFSKFYRRHYELISKFNVGLKSLLHQGLSEPEFYGDLVYKFKKIMGRTDFF